MSKALTVVAALLAAALAAALGILGGQLAAELPAGAEITAALGLALPVFRGSIAVAAGFVLFFSLGFLAPAVLSSLLLRQLSATLAGLAARGRLGETVAPAEFAAILRDSPLAPRAEPYVAALWTEKDPATTEATQNWWATVDATQSYRPVADRYAAAASLHGKSGFVVIGAGVAALAFGVYRWSGGSMTELGPAILLYAGAVLIGGAMFLLAATAGATLARQIALIAETTDAIFPPITGNSVLSQLAARMHYEGAQRDAAIARAQRGLSEEIARGIKEIGALISTHDERLATATATAVQRATAPVAESVAALAQRIATDHAESARHFLDAVMGEFSRGVATHLGEQFDQLGRILAATSTTAEGLHARFAGIVTDADRRHAEHEAALVGQLSTAIEGALGRAAAAPPPAPQAPAPRVEPAPAAGSLARALGDLRAETDAALRSLPEI